MNKDMTINEMEASQKEFEEKMLSFINLGEIRRAMQEFYETTGIGVLSITIPTIDVSRIADKHLGARRIIGKIDIRYDKTYIRRIT